MKKILLTLAIVTLGLVKFSNGQTSDDVGRGYIGFRFMPTFTSFNVRTIDNGTAATKFTLGYGYGLVLGGDFSNHVGMQGEVIYSMLSQKYADGNLTRNIKLSYVNIPLLLTLNTDVTAPVNLNVCFGPQIGINTGSTLTSGSGQSNPEVDTVSATLAVKPADLGFAYGAGLDFLLGRVVSLDIGYRGVLGLINVSDNSTSTTTNQYYILERAHVNTYAVYAGLKFRF